MEEEIGTGEALSIAAAVHACGGIVIAQVKKVAARGTLDPKDIKIPASSSTISFKAIQPIIS